MTNKLVRPGTLSEMVDGRPLPEHRDVHPDPGYGLGLMVWANDPLDHPLGHRGEGPGSRIAVFAHSRRVAAVWTALPSDDVDAEAQALALMS